MLSVAERRRIVLFLAGCWLVSPLTPGALSDDGSGLSSVSDTTSVARRVVDALAAARDENSELKVANQELKDTNQTLSTALKKLKIESAAVRRERDALRRAHYEESERREELEISVDSLERQRNQLKLDNVDLKAEVACLQVPAQPCPWTVLLTNLTDTARSRLQAACNGASCAPAARSRGSRWSRKALANGVPRERPLARHDPTLAVSLSDVALALQHAGQLEEAEAYLVWALMIVNAGPAGNHLATATALNNLGGLYLDMTAYSKAEGVYRSALAQYAYALDDDHPKLAALQNKLAGALGEQNRFLEAEKAYLRSIATYESGLGKGHAHLLAPIHNLAKLYQEMGRYADASAWLQRAMAIANRNEGAKRYIAHLEESQRRLDYAQSGRREEAPEAHPGNGVGLNP